MIRRQLPISAALLAIALAAAVFEAVRNPNLHTLPWSHLGLLRLGVYTGVFALATMLQRLSRVRPWPFFIGLAAIYGMAGVGVGPFAACILFCVSAACMGSVVFGDTLSKSLGELAFCFCLGEGILGFTACLLGHTYACYPVIFLLLLLAPIARQRRWLTMRLKAILRPPREMPLAETVATLLLVFAGGIQFLLVLKPEVGTDSLAMHLALPEYVAMHHHWAFDVREFLWAVMPQTVDWCYTLAYSLGGEFAARLLNFANLAAALGILWSLTERCTSRVASLLACALFTASPLVQVVTGSLFIDNAMAALVISAAGAFWLYRESGNLRLWAAGCLLFGLALSCKAGSLAFLPGIAALAALGLRKHPTRWFVWAGWAAAGLAIGSYIYALAWSQTGNPFFPVANEIFRSPLLPAERVSPHFQHSFTWRTPADLTFHSSQFIEGTDGSAGFQYFLLLPAALAVLAARRRPAVAWCALLGLSAAILAYLQIAYLRYLYAPFLLLMSPIALWLDEQRRGARWERWWAYTAVSVVLLANLLFQASSGWYHRDFVWDQLFHPEGAAEYRTASAPARDIVEVLNRIAPGQPALFCQYDHVAGFRGPIYSTNWHLYLRQEGLLDLPEGIDVLRYVNRRGIRYIAAPCPEDLDTWPRVLPVFFENFAERVFSPGRWVLYRVKPEFADAAGLEYARRLAADPPIAGPGIYDDADIRAVRAGDWVRDFSCAEAFDRSLTVSRHAGDEIRFRFHGSRAAVVLPRGPAFGMAEIGVDGESKTAIDEYAAAPAFRLRQALDVAPGIHTLSIRVSGRKNAASTDSAVAVDGFEIWP